MGKFKDAMKATGSFISAMADHEAEVKELTQKIMNKTYGVEYDQAEKVARMLLSQADITWK